MFVVLKHVYIPLLFFSGVDYIDAPTPYMMGLHSGVDTFGLLMDGVSSWINIYKNYISHVLRFFRDLSGSILFIMFYPNLSDTPDLSYLPLDQRPNTIT